MLQTWRGLAGPARAGIAVGSVLIVALMASLALWAYRPDYQVLFADMAGRDAAAMTAELDKLKVPYQLAGDGTTILVPAEVVYRTRLKLMGTDVPLHGAVGFEVFNNADFGVTDFVQKVNYQRAVQGELTRTIQSIDGVQSARVHLAIPEQGLFRQSLSKPKASVTITMRQGGALEPAQVIGIQRLVAASVPDITAADVTLTDQQGVTLSRQVRAGADASAGTDLLPGLEIKRATEDYLNRKLAQVLDKTFGPGEAIASVDVALDLDQVRITVDEVLPSHKAIAGETATGVVVRERHTTREGAADAASTPAGAASTEETDYQAGKRVEQKVVAPGAIRRLTIAAVVRQPLSEVQQAQLRDVIGLAVGLDTSRGDAIVVSALGSLVPAASNAVVAPVADVEAAAPTVRSADAFGPETTSVAVLMLAALGLLVAVIAGVAYRRRAATRRRHVAPRLSSAERARMTADVLRWIDAAAVPAETPAGRP